MLPHIIDPWLHNIHIGTWSSRHAVLILLNYYSKLLMSEALRKTTPTKLKFKKFITNYSCLAFVDTPINSSYKHKTFKIQFIL